jgi:hypothetical protein
VKGVVGQSLEELRNIGVSTAGLILDAASRHADG